MRILSRNCVAATVLFIALGGAPPVIAGSEFKPPPVGTELLWQKIGHDDTVLIVVGPTDGLKVSGTYDGREWVSATLFCWSCNPNRLSVDMSEMNDFFPLKVGKSAGIERTWESGIWNDTITVKERKTIKIPAGEFDVFVIEIKSENFSRSWFGTKIIYFSPGLGWIVIKKVKDSKGRDYAWQLISVNGKIGLKY